MRDGNVVVEAGAAEDELLAPRRGIAEEVLGVVCEDAQYHIVECVGCAGA